MSMWELRTKSTDKVVGDVDIYETIETTSAEIARVYFLNKKQLEEKEFDKIWRVVSKQTYDAFRREPSSSTHTSREWWNDEYSNLDIDRT